MKLKKDKWMDKDQKIFLNYLRSFENKEKIEWTRKIIQTKKPLLAIKTPVLKNIAKEITGGNYEAFLNLNLNNYYENSIINGLIIANIKDFDKTKKYLDIYITEIDNWAECDVLSFNVKNNEGKFYQLAQEYIDNKYPFARRVGLIILFKLINDKYIDRVLELTNSLHQEKDYYVNMANAWLLCEIFIKKRAKAINFLPNHNLNKFTINKMISKCRDSYRVNDKDKVMLLQYKEK